MLPHLEQEPAVLADYDAGAVAAVMGIAFVGDAGDARAASGASGRVRRTPMPALRPASAELIQRAVESGLPRFALRHVAEHLAGHDKAKIAALEWTVVPKTTLERREERLSAPESERTERIARLFVQARRALGSEAEARAFMTTPHPRLEGRTPLDAAKTDLGARRAEHILNAIEYGLAL
ncbi:MAG: DUF2384 domain-containing protein [Proteobacteria bacterium]|nr:DUF2384 domain-containing protein [Pseudomonadota bacterium]